jgi:inner membrane transporter RhtA
VMNCCFYLAIDRLPLGTVAAIEFAPVVGLAAFAARTPRNVTALAMAASGVVLLTQIVIVDDPLGVALAVANAGLFCAYIVLGHRVATDPTVAGIDGLAISMVVATVVALPIGIVGAAPALSDPVALAAAAGVGVCSSVVPYVCDQLAMARLPRATYALMVALLPAIAVLVGALVLRQVPTSKELAGGALVIVAVAIHQEVAPRATEREEVTR